MVRPRLAVAGSFLLFAAGCGYLGSASDFDPRELESSPDWLIVRDVPVVHQKETVDCGIAAILMVLGYWNVPGAQEAVAQSCPIVPDGGVRARDLRDVARGAGLRAFLIHGEWTDL